jgi:alanyl-tRNA synthetase
MTASEIARVESIVNQWILENTERSVEFLPIDEARERGAIAMFDEKYGDLVRVVAYGSRTMELCGGTHIDSLGQIGLIRVTSEGAIASGVRRIEMVAGELAYQQFKQLEYEVRDIAGMLKIPVKEVTPRVKRLLDDLKAREKQIAELERRLALADVQPMLDALQASTESVPVIGRYFPEATGDTLRVIAEAFRDGASKRPYILVLASSGQSKAQFVVAVADELTKQGYHAGEIVKRAAGLCGGGGGGKSNFAQAGGKDSEAVAGALETVTDELRSRTRVTAS